MTFLIGVLFLILIIVLSGYVVIHQGIEKAFLYVYLPIIFLTPPLTGLKFKEGLPGLSLDMAALLPIIPGFVFLKLRYWRFTLLDFLVLAFAFSQAYSYYVNNGTWAALSNFFYNIFRILLPYSLGKILIEPYKLSVTFAKQIVTLMLINSPFFLQEFLTGKSIYVQVIWKIFPEQKFSYNQLRYGFFRATGPFVHSILAGLVIVITHRLSRWLELTHQWKSRYYPFGNFISKGNLISLILIAMLLTTLSRGPWLGAIFGAIIFSACKEEHKSFKFFVRVFLIFVLALTFYFLLSNYVDKNEQFYEFDSGWELTTALYRSKLIEAYLPFVWEKPWFGWGLENAPVVHNYGSLDNFYLFLAIVYGVITLLLFILISMNLVFRLYRKGFFKKLYYPRRLLAFTMLSSYIALLIIGGTVWFDIHILVIAFMFIGWCEGFILAKEDVPNAPRKG